MRVKRRNDPDGQSFLDTACGALDAQPIQAARVLHPQRNLPNANVKVVDLVAR